MAERKPYIPLYTDLTGKKVMVAGSGEEAARMIRYLSMFADDLYLLTLEDPDALNADKLSPDGLNPDGQNRAGCRVTVLNKLYERTDLYGMDYVVSVAGDRAVDEDIYITCKTLGIRVNIASNPKRCDFFLSVSS